jgi:hypothetical protein
MILKNILVPVLFMTGLTGETGYAQIIKGQIADNMGVPIPFAVVYDETTFSGTTGNADGYYELKLEPGTHSLVYKAMGYNQIRKLVNSADEVIVQNIQLTEQPIKLKEVVITPGKEDPAYGIMRKVIALAPYHLNQVKQYTADVYLRGTAQIIKMPKFIAKHTSINGATNVLKSGDVYLEESQNQIKFIAPDKYEQKVISIRSSFPWNNEKINPMGMINASLYQPKINDIISPLAPNAFHFYNYRYEGFFEEGNKVVFKIRILPKHNNQQLMSGYLYIVDQLWCLHSADVALDMFFGSMKFRIIYSSIRDNAWLPISYQFYAEADIMGVNANYKYNSSVKFREVILNEKNTRIQAKTEAPEKPVASVADTKAREKQEKNRKAIEELLSKDELTNRDMVKLATLASKETNHDTLQSKSLEIRDSENNKQIVEKDAVKNDTAFWNNIRPIPLTAIESKISAGPDSIALPVNKSSSDSDSIEIGSKKKGGSKFMEFFARGSEFRLFDSTFIFRYEGLIGLKKFDFNTADGFIYRQAFTLSQKIDSSHWLHVKPGIAYAFNRKRFMWRTDISYEYAPLRSGKLNLYMESGSTDFNGETGINSSLNTISSLFFRRNYMKLFHQHKTFLSNQIDLANGLILTATLGYRVAQPLGNHSEFSFFYKNERDYTDNTPGRDDKLLSAIHGNEEAYWEAMLQYTPEQHYKIIHGKKQYINSRFPTLYLHNRMAMPGIVKSTADYDLLEIGIRQNKTWGMLHAFYWHVKAGFYINSNRLYAMDYKFFGNQDIPVTLGDTREYFRLVPYYHNATTGDFAEIHARFTTPYLLIKFLPLLNNKLWCENLSFNYLAANHRQYWEAGYSISQIYMMGSVGIYAGFEDTTFLSAGLQISIDF